MGNAYITGNVFINSTFTNASSASYQNDGDLYLTGDFTNDQPGIAEGSGTTRFINTSLQHINGSQSPAFHDVYINNAAGVQMNLDVSMGGTISPVAGTLYFNDHTLTMGGMMSPLYTNTAAFNVTRISDLIINGPAASGNNLYFDAAGNTLHDLTVAANATGALGNALNITAGSNYGTVIVDGSFNAAGFLTIKSDLNGDARVGISSGTITNNATVERFIPARRAWRFLAIPFSSSTQSINQAWQEGYTNTTLDCPVQYPGTPGFGTEITYNGVNGYDLNTTNNPSIKVWESNAWATLNSTLIPKITDHDAYCIFVRGDRRVCLKYAIWAIPNNTVLRATGILNQTGGVNTKAKNFTGTAGQFFFVGNPYASPVDLTNVVTGSRVSGFDANKIWVWDPKLAGTYGVGDYVTFSNGVWAPAGGSYPAGSGSLPIIQSGQAFMVQTNNTNASVTFVEADKANAQSHVFGFAPNNPFAVVYANLMQPGDSILLDGVATGFDNKFSADVDATDAGKRWNIAEDIALLRGTENLAIEFRPIPTQADTLFFRLYVDQHPYALKIFTCNPANLPAQAWFVDRYLKTQTEINLADTTLYSFTPNTDTNSYRNRFILVFKPRPANPVITKNNEAKVSPVIIFPNPVDIGESVTVLLNNISKNTFEAVIYSLKGQKLISRKIEHPGGTASYALRLPSSITAGVYELKLVNKNTVVNTTRLVIKSK